MRHYRLRTIGRFLVLLVSFAMPDAALAEEAGRWLLQTSIYTAHFSPNPEHDNTQKLLNLEYRPTDRWLVGAAAFDSSFGQPSQYVYYGRLWRPFESAPLLQVKLTGGLVHGYKGKYRDKIPLNTGGIAPALIPSLGLSGRHLSAEVVLFGTAGAMATIGVLF